MFKHLFYLSLIAASIVPSFSFASGPFRQVRRAPNFQNAHHVQGRALQVQRKDVIVNNLVGIPVPVTYSQPVSAQGRTVYGYSDATRAYQQVDLGILYNQAARLTDQAQQLAGQAHQDFQTLIIQEGASQQEIELIRAQGIAASQALQAVRIPERTSQSFSLIQDSRRTQDIQRPSPQKGNVIQNACTSCHNGGNPQGGLDMTQPLSDSQQEEVLNRITTSDPVLSMPKGKPRLSMQEIRSLILEL